MAEKKSAPQEGPKEAKGSKSSKSMLKVILLILILLLILGAGGGAAYYFLLRDKAAPGDETAEEAPQPAAESGAKHESKHESKHEPEPEKDAGHGEPGGGAAAPVYHPLPTVTVNIAPPSPVRFLRLNITVVTRNELVIAAMDKHMPMIRNDMLVHLSTLTYNEINSPEGKDKLRSALKTIISGILTRASEPSGIDEIIFTELVMQ